MLRPKLVLNPKQMDLQMEIAMQRMVEEHTEMMRVLTQNMVNRNSNEIPPGMQQVLDNHTRIIQMMSQNLADTNNNLPRKDHGGNEARGDVEMTLRACKRCGEVGHTSKECHEQCSYCDTSHPVGECPMTQVTCYLCEGINHIPLECKFYSTVQRMNQQAKHGLSQLLGKTQEDGRSKMKVGDKISEITPNHTTKCDFSREKEEEHLSRNCSRKRERFPTAIVEFGEMEVRDLLALERPKKKDTRKVWCFNCKERGHYAKECPEEDNKANRPGGMKKNLNHITCYTCKQQGHYSYQCTKNGTSRLQ
jgi:hypothetical protein